MTASGRVGFVRKHRIFLAALAAVGVFAALMAWFLAKPLWPAQAQYTDLWDSENSEGWDVYVFVDGAKQELSYAGSGSYTGPLENTDVFYASRTLETIYENALLEIQSATPVAVFLDDELLYAEAPLTDPRIGEVAMETEFSGRTVPLFLPLPGDYGGKRLTIVRPIVSEKENAAEVFLGPVSLQSQTRYETGIISGAARAIYPGLILTCLGFAFVVLLLSNAYSNRFSWDILFFAGFIFLLAVEFFLFSDSLAYYYPNTIQTLSVQGFALCCLFLCLAAHLDRFRMPTLILTGALAGLLVWLMLANIFQVFIDWLPDLINDAAFGTAMTVIVFEFLEARRGRPFPVLFRRFFLLGAAALAAVLFISWLMKTEWFASFALQMEIMAENLYFGYALTIMRYLLICVCSVTLCVWFARDAVQRRVDAALIAERAEATEKNMEQMREHAGQLAMLRHDMRKHLGVASLYLQASDQEKAARYLREVGDALDAVPAVIFTGNATVDLILNAQTAQAEEDGLNLSAAVHPLPELPLSETEISSLLINAFENAFRAARDTEAREVEAQLYVRDGFFCFSCRNSCLPRALDSEASQSGHGYGLRIIEEIAERHDGMLKIQRTEDRFILSAAFPLS